MVSGAFEINAVKNGTIAEVPQPRSLRNRALCSSRHATCDPGLFDGKAFGAFCHFSHHFLRISPTIVVCARVH
uniref:Uncharacterized protein n=1 Tax=Caenorhabditis japonica TaxID=281687 RepID=A0A8R1EQ70_CAEJA